MIVLISKAWSSPQTQEILQKNLDPAVYAYILDKIDDVRYDPMEKIMPMRLEEKISEEEKDNDFVIDIIKKEREFNAQLGILDDEEARSAANIASVFQESQIQKVTSVSDVIALESARGSKPTDDQEFALKVKPSQKQHTGNKRGASKQDVIAQNASDTTTTPNPQPGSTAFFIPSTLPPVPPRPNKALMKVSPELDLRKKVKGNKMAEQMLRDAVTYDEYKGTEHPSYRPDPPEDNVQPEEVLDTAFKHYFGERGQYTGKFDPGEDGEENDPGYERYKKVFVCGIANTGYSERR